MSAKLKICPDCGTAQPDHYVHCAQCGASLQDAQVVQPYSAGPCLSPSSRPPVPSAFQSRPISKHEKTLRTIVVVISLIVMGYTYFKGGSFLTIIGVGIITYLVLWVIIAGIFWLQRRRQ